MNVRVDAAGKNELSFGIEYLGAGPRCQILADFGDQTVTDAQIGILTSRRVNDRSIPDDDFVRLLCLGSASHSERDAGGGKASFQHGSSRWHFRRAWRGSRRAGVLREFGEGGKLAHSSLSL